MVGMVERLESEKNNPYYIVDKTKYMEPYLDQFSWQSTICVSWEKVMQPSLEAPECPVLPVQPRASEQF